jgi:hypothetical protein
MEMETVSVRFEPMTTGVLLDRAFRLYTANFALMLGITAVAYVPFELTQLVIEASLEINARVSSDGLSALLYFVVLIILWYSVAFPLAGGAATYAISERYLSKDVTIADALRCGLTCFWTISLAELIATIRMIFGFCLLIIPGILWMLSYTVIVPAILVEGQEAIPSLERSRELIKGHRGKAFCVMLVFLLLHIVVVTGLEMIASWIFSLDSGEEAFFNSALNSLVSILITPIYVIATILLYYDMRIRKEGFDLEMLSRSFTTEGQPLAAAPTASR